MVQHRDREVHFCNCNFWNSPMLEVCFGFCKLNSKADKSGEENLSGWGMCLSIKYRASVTQWNPVVQSIRKPFDQLFGNVFSRYWIRLVRSDNPKDFCVSFATYRCLYEEFMDTWLPGTWSNMEFSIFIRGLIIGFSIAAPVGPIGVLCIRRTLAEGRLSGFVSGLGAATADAIYGSVAGFGLTFISIFLIQQSQWLRLLGGGFLIFLGIRTFLTQPVLLADPNHSSFQGVNLTRNYLSTFILTLTNPLTIISFAAIFAALGIGTTASGNYISAIILVIGVFLGSCSWWFLLSGAVGLFRQRIKPDPLKWVNRISGIIIIIFGIIAIFSLF